MSSPESLTQSCPCVTFRIHVLSVDEKEEVQVGYRASNLRHQIQAKRDEATSENRMSMAQRLNEMMMDADLPTRNLQYVQHKMKQVVSCKVNISVLTCLIHFQNGKLRCLRASTGKGIKQISTV